MPFEAPTELSRGGNGEARPPSSAGAASVPVSPLGQAGLDPNEAPTRANWRTRSDAVRAGGAAAPESQTLAKSAPTGYSPPVAQPDTQRPPITPEIGSAPTRIYRPERATATSPAGAVAPDRAQMTTEASSTPTAKSSDGALPVGWLVVTHGPGRGKLAPLFFGWNRIGRSPELRNQVVLNYGDDGISSEDHAAIVYDETSHTFHLAHRQGLNGTYVNGGLVLSPTAIDHGHSIRISQTTLRFVRLCGADFSW